MKSEHKQIFTFIILVLTGQTAVPQFGAKMNLADLNGSNGFTINGVAAEDYSGTSVSHAGDVNGDGIDDLIIGAPYAERLFSDIGSSYVVFGNAGGFSSTLDLSSLDSSNGFTIYGDEERDNMGLSVNHAGDINGDGIDDLIIGADRADHVFRNVGSSYVVFGNAGGFTARIYVSKLNGINGFTMNGVSLDEHSGQSVSHAGDVNGDGIDDLIIGAPRADPGGNSLAGRSYVVFGDAGGFSSTLDLSSLNGSNGFSINGVAADDGSGASVSHAGDVNGDGIDDLIIGAPLADPDGKSQAGRSYVVFGNAGGFSSILDLSSLNGSNGFTINGVVADDRSGGSVSHAGDINGDGIDDLIIGASRADPNGNSQVGSSYVVFGDAGGFTPTLNLSLLTGSNGFTINGVTADDRSGSSVSQAGDVNGDGIDDLIIGASGADPDGNFGAGSSYVVFGSDGGFTPTLDLSSLNGSNGFTINGVADVDISGRSVSHAGDVNGDGIDDLIIGASDADPNGNFGAGSSYVVMGRKNLIFKDGFE